MKKSESEPIRPQRHQKSASKNHEPTIEVPTEVNIKALDEECLMTRTSSVVSEETSTDSDTHSSKSSKSTKTSEESHENKWKRFWDQNRERFKHKTEDDIPKNRSFDEITAEVDAIFRKAIRSMRPDRPEDRRPSIDLEEPADKNNYTEEVQSSRKARSKFKEHKLREFLSSDSIEKKPEEDTLKTVDEEKDKDSSSRLNVPESIFFVDLSDEEKSKLGKERLEEIRDPSSRRWSSLENLRAKMDNAREKSYRTRIDSLSIEKPVKVKEKRTMDSLRSSLERKMGSVERILEDHMEKIIEGNLENRLWLLPIENWIVERCKHSGIHQDTDVKLEERKLKRGDENFEFKSAPEREDEASRLEQKKCEKLKKSELKNEEEKVEVALEKDVKHHDLFDKFKDNVKEKMEDIHRYFQRTNRLADVNRRLKSQIWSSVVTIVLVEAKNLLPMDIDGLSDPYVKFRLGTEKYKSKVVHKTLNPVWLEQFDLHLYEDPYLGQELEVTVWDRDKSHQDDLMGRTVIDLATLERETTHRLWRDLEDGSGNIFLLLTISGTTASETISDLAAHEETPREREQLFQRYSIMNTLQRLRDVGHLTVKVFRAQGLAAADLGGKSDPFCVLELVNARLQTQTEYKTLAPNWQKIFTLSCWEWESKMRSIIALVIFILGCYYFEPYMFPGAALLILLKYYLLYGDGSGLNQWISGQVSVITGTPLSHHTSSHYYDEIDDGATTPGDDDDDEDDKDKEEKKSLKERLQTIQEVTQMVQNSMGYIASLCERVKNLFNFTVPYLSYLAMILTILGAAVLYFIPLRYLILAWGVNKFSRKIIRPHSVPNNEVLDLISRVPDDEELINYRELKPLPTADCEKGSTSGSPGPSNLTRREQRKRHKAA
ncbi:multiple C2 domain and transmembrane region protein isoform X6 [Megachile rotundata]|uniref:multiple C2 domain and transmembrane region protein isoform X6 n=1 Tax=Megachile rotundata TaxID=143995 RepID=UPI0006152917|nr:PREDICTED: multiple C2 and transmembrane domain-containing protein 2 isoform X3 [Megachile rotundata]